MNRDFIFIWYQRIKKKTPSGQIAALLTLVIAIIFIFIAITINIGKISKTKLLTQIASDTAALNLASILSSIGNYHVQTNLEGKISVCKYMWNPIFALFVIAIAIISMIFTGPVTLAEILLLLSGILDFVTDVFISTPAMIEAFNSYMRDLDGETKLEENAIQSALTILVNDPVFVQDIHDYDQDEDTNDLIYRFEAWYAERLLVMGNKFKIIEDFIKNMLPKLKVADDNLYDFVIYTAGDQFSNPDNPPDPEETEFKIWMKEVENGISYKNIDINANTLYNETITTDFPFWKEGVEDEAYDRLDEFVNLAISFHLWAYGGWVYNAQDQKMEFIPGILNLSMDTLKDAFRTWYPALLNYARNFNGWMKPLRCWIWNYWGCSDCDHLAGDCDVGSVTISNDRDNNETVYDNTLRYVLVEKIVELEEKIKKITDEETKKKIKESIDKLNEHISKIDTTVGEFSNARGGMFVLETFISDTLKNNEFIKRLNELSQPNIAIYSWQDSLGWHAVRVRVVSERNRDLFYNRCLSGQSPNCKIKSPYPEKRKVSWFKTCAELKNPTGLIGVEVTRYDEDNPVKFSSGGLLWNFRIRKNPSQEIKEFDPENPEYFLDNYGIKSIAIVAYGPKLTDIYFE
ncbi:MAG: hypothetical protein NC900_05535 [Candidatus Omnitrophica bacterium]|nr:hypothetical protein [Candidatus Omnitrophota bacterium]